MDQSIIIPEVLVRNPSKEKYYNIISELLALWWLGRSFLVVVVDVVVVLRWRRLVGTFWNHVRKQ